MTREELIKKFEEENVNDDGTIYCRGHNYKYLGVDIIVIPELDIDDGYDGNQIGILVDSEGNEPGCIDTAGEWAIWDDDDNYICSARIEYCCADDEEDYED